MGIGTAQRRQGRLVIAPRSLDDPALSHTRAMANAAFRHAS